MGAMPSSAWACSLEMLHAHDDEGMAPEEKVVAQQCGAASMSAMASKINPTLPAGKRRTTPIRSIIRPGKAFNWNLPAATRIIRSALAGCRDGELA